MTINENNAVIKLLDKRNPEMDSVRILDVFCLNGFYYAKPSKGSYEKIWRAARGVYWDESKQCLYFKGITSREKALQIIAQAMEAEYCIKMIFD